jgi:hypothetical protein
MNEKNVINAIDALKAQQAEYSNTVWRTMSFLMIAIGWVISADETREFLCSEPIVRWGAIFVTCVMALMHFLSLQKLYKASFRIWRACLFPDELSRAVASSYEIKCIYVLTSFSINFLLFLLLGIILFKTA